MSGEDGSGVQEPYARGERYRITFEADLLEVTRTPNGQPARLILRSGKGMNDSVWLARESGFGNVISVERVSETPTDAQPTPRPTAQGREPYRSRRRLGRFESWVRYWLRLWQRSTALDRDGAAS